MVEDVGWRKNCVVLHVNDVSLRLVILWSKVQLFYTKIIEQTGGGRGERRVVVSSL
jgi:hypothetical protein